MAELPLVYKIFGMPTKLFYDAFRHTQRVVSNDQRRPGEAIDHDDEINPFVGFRISLLIGVMALISVFQTWDLRSPVFVILTFTGLSCAWQLRPFWRELPRLRGRVPRPGVANWVLSHHAATSVFLEAFGNSAMVLSLVSVGFFAELNLRAVIGIVLILMWLPFNRFVFINLAVLELLKYYTASRLNFSVFRRFQTTDRAFDDGFDARHRQIVLPVLGAFGRVTVPFNESLDQTRPGPNSDTEEINAQTKKAIKFDHETWVHQVEELIHGSDVAVFHWGSVLSKSMLLEFRIAKRLLTPRRMILVVDEDAGALFELCKHELNLSMQVISVKGGYAGFLRDLREALRTMAATDVSPESPDTDQPAWNSYVWDALQSAAKRHPEAGLPCCPWRLPASLGGAECEVVMVAGHIMGRGRDDIGWFHIRGSYQCNDDCIDIEATQHYVTGERHTFYGRVLDDSRIRINVSGRPGSEMIYALPP